MCDHEVKILQERCFTKETISAVKWFIREIPGAVTWHFLDRQFLDRQFLDRHSNPNPDPNPIPNPVQELTVQELTVQEVTWYHLAHQGRLIESPTPKRVKWPVFDSRGTKTKNCIKHYSNRLQKKNLK